jgi:hypothetical protein
MDINQFWKLNEGLPVNEAADTLTTRLSVLTPNEIVEYDRHFRVLLSEAYRWSLWGAAYLIGGGCSDDGFHYFRCGLISRGRSVYQTALHDPDSLALVDVNDDGCIENEEFGYVAGTVYETMTGTEIPQATPKDPDEPAGEEWDFEDDELLKSKLPKVWGKFCSQPTDDD